ncbi:MAG: hypothetical protein KIT84_23345 [Labilithrix sp.]|nr:hypothetical protein [Labilithrix sp.]MCW5813983.1 hypothetical protein [Labilithrix sp.]
MRAQRSLLLLALGGCTAFGAEPAPAPAPPAPTSSTTPPAPDGGAAAPDGGEPSSALCAAKHTLCDDFESGGTSRWSDMEGSESGSITVVESPDDPSQHVLEAKLEGNSEHNPSVQLKHFAPIRAEHVELSFDVKLLQTPTNDDAQFFAVLHFRTQPPSQINVGYQDGRLHLAVNPSHARRHSDDPVALTSWTRLKVSIDWSNEHPRIEVFQNGASRFVETPKLPTTRDDELHLDFGVYVSPTTAAHTLFDNVVYDVR